MRTRGKAAIAALLLGYAGAALGWTVPSAMAGVAMGSAAASATAGDIELRDGFARALPAGPSNGGGYVTITNHGDEPDRLVALSSPSSREVEIHETIMSDSTMRMRPLPSPLEIRPGQTVKLQPQGDLHLVLVGLSQPLKEGSEIALTLTFEKAGKIALKLPVLAVGTPAPGDPAPAGSD